MARERHTRTGQEVGSATCSIRLLSLLVLTLAHDTLRNTFHTTKIAQNKNLRTAFTYKTTADSRKQPQTSRNLN
jgi:hypothetical protein